MALNVNTKILVIDDSESSLGIVRGVLKRKGFKQIITAYDGHEAKEIIQTEYYSGIPVELILSDWEMPKFKGIELLNFIRQSNNYGDTPFIMITSNNEIKHIAEAIKLGVSSYIIKPINVEILLSKIAASFK